MEVLATPEIVKNVVAWVKNLRSGQFPQIRGKMHTLQGYCCLGIGCVTLNQLHLGLFIVDFIDGVYKYRGGKWGFDTYFGLWDTLQLVKMNDEILASFDEIADAIVSVPYGWFRPQVAEALRKEFGHGQV